MRVSTMAVAFGLGLLVACGGGGSPADSDAGVVCQTDDQCSDGLFCTGEERCDPSDPSASTFGCIDARSPCASTQTCDELQGRCTTTCDLEPDADGDGYEAIECGGTDCDDTDPNRFPGNVEVCDPDHRDEDCDPRTFGVRDADGDGYPDALCCNEQADGSFFCGDDCDDTRASVNPMATEACNGIDDDCDGRVDEGVLRRFWPDADRDGFGDMHADPVEACNPPLGHVENDLDCDDTNQLVNPATSELCDGIDNNCNGEIDEAGSRNFYRDQDGDGFGDPTTVMTLLSCEAPIGYVPIGTDCNDEDPTQHPGATELCNRRDDDCSQAGAARGGVDPTEDADDDGHSAPDAACEGGPFPKDDCNDTNPTVYGGARELCDAFDNDCDMVVDEGASAHCGGTSICDDGDCVAGGRLAAGAAVSCATTGGAIDCWTGQGLLRGDGSIDTARASIGRVAGIVDARHVTVSQSSSAINIACALRASGRVACWGRNGEGALGDGSFVDSPTPVEVESLVDAVDVRAGNASVCARRRTGQVVCWGDNQFGQLGDGTTTRRGVPVTVLGVEDAIELAVGAFHACARSRNGEVRCWGVNDRGQLANGTTTNASTAVPALEAAGVQLAGVDRVVAGNDYTCFLRAGSLRCSGRPSLRGRPELFSPAPPALYPEEVVDLPGVDSIVAGPFTACATSGSGTTQCWGRDLAGECANGERASQRTPTPTFELGTFDEMSLGSGLGCVRTGDAVRCWGAATLADHVGDGGASLPFTVRGFAAGVRPGHAGRCAADEAGAFWCWGPTPGELAGLTSPSGFESFGASVPFRLATLDGAVSAAATDTRICAVTPDGRVRCFGANANGALGDGTTSSATSPRLVIGLEDAVEVSLSSTVGCARSTGGGVHCWSGNSPANPGSTPTPVLDDAGELDDAAQVSAGGAHSACAVRATGELVCWSYSGARLAGVPLGNAAAELDTGGPVRRVALATAVRSLGGDRDLSACVVRLDGSVACTGWFGGSFVDTFESVVGLTNALDVAVGTVGFGSGRSPACALGTDGRVRCWGAGPDGQLGDPNVTLSSTPVAVEGLDDAVSIASSVGTFCAISTSRGLVCWGSDTKGSLGRGVARPVRSLL